MASSQDVNDALQQATNGSDDAPAELTAVVDELLDSLSSKFSSVSSEIFTKMDEMSRRLDSLEGAIQSSDSGTQK
ncbi:MAG: hypothetical protein M1837_002638 [Sclerophora amabilis]|nr:MAG: hypothetical protein M1837_002638 [Sclerophora amabilis]